MKGTTYSKEGDVAVGSVDRYGKLPGIPVTKSSNDGLESLRGSDEDGCAENS